MCRRPRDEILTDRQTEVNIDECMYVWFSMYVFVPVHSVGVYLYFICMYVYVYVYVYACNWSATNDMVQEAMRVIREQHELGRPFFLNLWFDAPHRCLSYILNTEIFAYLYVYLTIF